MNRNIISILFLTFMGLQLCSQNIYLTREGILTFNSDAPLELISATSDELSGAINLITNSFAFKVTNKSLKGFNSSLQQEHFYENYMEVEKYPSSTFQGKIIEKIEISEKGIQHIRAKGILSVHGKKKERIIDAQVEFMGNLIIVNAQFDILLEDHNIRIPNIVYQKIAEVISVEIKANLSLEKDN